MMRVCLRDLFLPWWALELVWRNYEVCCGLFVQGSKAAYAIDSKKDLLQDRTIIQRFFLSYSSG